MLNKAGMAVALAAALAGCADVPTETAIRTTTDTLRAFCDIAENRLDERCRIVQTLPQKQN